MILFDAVVFDLDGTLIATDRFWVQAARTGARRAFQELGLEREPPGASQWMDVVGKPLAEGFDALFPELTAEQRAQVQRACVEEEHRLLDAGGGSVLMPGALELLRALRGEGLSLAIASNCSSAYLEHMLGLGIGELVDEAYCLDSPGITNKRQMIARALERFGTESAVMVGDRAGDRDAAWANGLPHVHCAFGFARREETIEAQATIEDLNELFGVLRNRERWITAALEEAGALRGSFLGALGSPHGSLEPSSDAPAPAPTPVAAPGAAPAVLGIEAPPLGGSSLFARDAARVYAARCVPARVVSLASFADPGQEHGVDWQRLHEAVLAPRARGEEVALETCGTPGTETGAALLPSELLLLEGSFVSHPRLASSLTRLVRLDVDEDLILMRAAARLGGDPERLTALRSVRWPDWLAFQEARPAVADLVLEAGNPLGQPGPPDAG